MPFFLDTFNGSGAISGHAPDVTFPGYPGIVWTSSGTSPPTLSGSGALEQSTEASGYALYGAVGDISAGTGPVDVLVTFTIRTGAGVNTGLDRAFNPYIKVMYNTGVSLVLNLAELATGWELGDSLASYPVTLTDNTSYTGTMQLIAGVFEWSFLGLTGGMTVTPSTQYTSGVQQLRLKSTPGIFFEQVAIADPHAANAALTAPMATLVAGVVVVESVATVAATAPAPTLSAYGGANAALTGTFPALYATGRDSTGEQAANLGAPRPTLIAFGGANAKLSSPSPTLDITATTTNWGQATLAGPAPALSASGTVYAMAQAILSPPMATLLGYSGAVCSITLTGHPTLQASSTTGSIGGAALTCPLFELTASATAQNHGSANLLAPSPRLGATAQAWLVAPGATLTAIGHAVVAATYEAYAINLNHDDPAAHDEVTRYNNFPFTQIVRYQGSYFGVAADGLYLLEGTTDDGATIPWAFKTAMTDFESPFLKTVVSSYFGGRLGPAATIDLHVGEDGATSYSYATPRSDHAQTYRQKFGRGLKSRYYALGAAGAGTLELDNIEFETLNSTRRI
ncbi:hypothetical protein [Rhodoferax ferrireducens]|uniref:hypothetical protein n=1 Tax=Rhodoferax ferrireducens TaxID=192843 RepID=UPI0013007574|nr:hypothetical protein [Rhodoferax ferrireducens]